MFPFGVIISLVIHAMHLRKREAPVTSATPFNSRLVEYANLVLNVQHLHIRERLVGDAQDLSVDV